MGTVQTVPIIDVAPFLTGDLVGAQDVVRQVGRACETIGFLVLTGHGIDPALQFRTLSTETITSEGDTPPHNEVDLLF